MYGLTVGKLQVYMKSGGKMGLPVWNCSGNHGDKWHEAQVAVNNQTVSYEYVIEGVRGKGTTGHIAIDDISLMVSCPPRENQNSESKSVNSNGCKNVTTTFTVSTTPAISPSRTIYWSEGSQNSEPKSVNNNGSKKMTTTFTTTPAISPSRTIYWSEENQPSKPTVNNNGSEKKTTTFTVSTTPAILSSQITFFSEDKGTTGDSSRIIIIATTVGAGIFLSIVLIVLLIKYKRRKRAPKLSTPVNIPLETNEISPDPLPVDEELCHETVGNVYDDVGTSGNESEDPSAEGWASLYDWVGVPSNADKASEYETSVKHEHERPDKKTAARVNRGFCDDVATNANKSEDISAGGWTSDHEEVEVPSNAHKASGHTELNKRSDTLKKGAIADDYQKLVKT